MEDSLELIRDYVIVPRPPIDVSSHSMSASKPSQDKYQNLLQASANILPALSAPVQISGASNINTHRIGSHGSCDYPPRTSLESMNLVGALEKPSSHHLTRIKSLRQCASAVKELVNEKASPL